MSEPIRLERNEAGVQAILPGSAVRWETEYHPRLRRYVMQAFVEYFSRPVVDEHWEWPETWWDAFKERWFPMWLKRRVGVNFTVVDYRVDEIAKYLKLPPEHSVLMVPVLKNLTVENIYRGDSSDAVD